jgi:hypothetical protein
MTPVLLSPEDGAVLTGDPVFQWKEVPGVNSYQLVLYDSGNQLIWSKFIQDDIEIQYDGTELITPESEYKWSVRDRVDNVWRQLSPFFYFQKELPDTVLPAPSVSIPPDGESIVFPELFSWSELDGAGRYEISVFDDSTITTLLYQNISEQNSIFIPAGLQGLTDLKDYYWMVRGIDADGYAGEYSEVMQFLLTDIVSPPLPPTPIYPGSADTVQQETVTFIWQPSSGATHYTLEFSRDSLYTPSSDVTWAVERISDSLYTAQLREGSSLIYWRVRALNNAGNSSWSGSSQFVYDGGAVPQISSVEILEPESGSEIELGSSFMPDGFVSGSHSGTVEGSWLLNGTIVDSFTVSMNPTQGIRVRGPVISATDIGPDTLIMKITSPDSISSSPMIYDVVYPSFGSPSAIHIVASPFAIPADSQSQSAVTAYIVDSEGKRVYTDYARLVHFVVLGEGYPVGPTASLTDSGLVRLTVSSTATPDQDVLVLVYSPGLTGDYTYIMTYDEELEEYLTRTLAHIGRLETLPLDYYPEEIDTFNNGYDLSGVWDFLNQKILGIPDPPVESVESLKRMMLALRFIGMCYYYEHHPVFPEEDEQHLYGMGYLLDYLSGPTSGGAIITTYFSLMADTILQRAEDLPVARRVSHSIFKNAQHLFEGVSLPTAELMQDPVLKNRVFRALSTSHREAAALARSGEDSYSLIENYTLRLNRQFEFLDDYITATQYLIDSVATWAQSDNYSSTFEASREEVDNLLTEVRSITMTAYLEGERLDYDSGILESSKELSILGQSIAQGVEQPRLISNFRESASYISYPERWSGTSEILPLAVSTMGEVRSSFLPDGVWSSFGLENGQRAQVGGLHPKPLSKETVQDVLDVLQHLSNTGAAFELTVNSILSGLSSDDSITVVDNIAELCDEGDELLELMYFLRGTFGSFSNSAEAAVAGFDQFYQDMNQAYFAVSNGIISFELSLLDYLYNREYDYSSAIAVQSGFDAVTMVNEAIREYSETIPSFFDLPAVPALVQVCLDYPDSIGPMTFFGVNTFLVHTGSGDVSDVSAVFSFEGPFELLSADSIMITSISPGDSVELSWQLKTKPLAHPDFARGLFSCSIEVHASGSIAYPRYFHVKTYKKNFGVNYVAKETGSDGGMSISFVPKVFRLFQNSPNPFNPQTNITYDIPEGDSRRVRLKVYNVRGKLVKNLVDEIKEAGRYTVHWDGRDNRGRKLGTGIYFYVIDAGPFRSVRKMILHK